jgi:hypothetical protein
MKLKTVFILQTIVSTINGLGMLLLPAMTLGMYGVPEQDAYGLSITRLFGSGLLTYAIVAWLARDAGESQARRAIVVGFGITHALGFVISLIGQLNGLYPLIHWMVPGLYLFFTVVYGIHFFRKEPA